MTLAQLKLTAARKPTNIAPTQQRRNKLARRLAEQIELARAEQRGSVFRPTKLKTVKDAVGNTQTVETTKRVKAWWFVSEAGKLCVNVRYGAKLLELAKGKTAVEVATDSELVGTLQILKAAVETGELDAQMEAASGQLRSGFKR